MKSSKFLKSILSGLYGSLRRFPAALCFSTAATLLLIILTHNERDLSTAAKDNLGRIIMVLALGFPSSLCISLLFERIRSIKVSTQAAIHTAVIPILLLYYFLLLRDFNMVSATRYTAVSLALYLAFLFIPNIGRKYGFELYVIKIFIRFITTVIYSVVLYAGLSAILFTIDRLLGVTINVRIYLDLFLITAGIFAPAFLLADVPAYSDQFQTDEYPKLLKVLLAYIVMPIISAYTAILYIYFAKVIITLQWPNGIVGHLVLWYSIISLLIVYLISPLSTENLWVKKFIFWLTKLILPLIVLMFISLGIRIRAYGITENRYFVLLLGLWVFAMMIYLNIKGTHKNIVLPISLAIIAILSVAGPWSSYSVSKWSQNARFESILVRNGMLEGGKLVKAGDKATLEDKNEITQILRYFARSHSLNDVRYIPSGFKIADMENVLGFGGNDISTQNYKNAYFSYSADIGKAPLEIAGYDFIMLVRDYKSKPPDAYKGLEVKYDQKTFELKVFMNDIEIYSKYMTEYFNKLYDKYSNISTYNLPPEEMSFEDINEKVKIKFIIVDANGKMEESQNKIKLEYMQFYMLIDIK